MVNEKLSPQELTSRIKSFLSEHVDGALATCMNNMPRSSPVQYFMGDNLNIYILSAGGDKFNAIAQNPNVCLLVNTEYISYRKIKGVQLFGKATTSMQDGSLFNEAKAFAPDSYMMDRERNNLNVIKIVPDEIVYLDSLREGDRTKEILKGNQVLIKEDSNTQPKTPVVAYI